MSIVKKAGSSSLQKAAPFAKNGTTAVWPSTLHGGANPKSCV